MTPSTVIIQGTVVPIPHSISVQLTTINCLCIQDPIPMTADLDPLSMLTDDADVASWNNEGKYRFLDGSMYLFIKGCVLPSVRSSPPHLLCYNPDFVLA